MKKTVFISALLLCSIAFGETNFEYNSTYGAFVKTTSYDIHSLSFTLGDNVTATLSTTGNLYTRPNSSSSLAWTNTAALTAMNNDLGLNIGADVVRSFTRPGEGGKTDCALTLNFSQSTVYEAGDTITLYIVASYNDLADQVYTPTITGLTVTSTSYASATGSDFDAKLTGLASSDKEQALPTLMKLTGVLGEDRIITIGDSDHARFGVGMVALKGIPAAVPEPATATLSLLALAGLCTRRRRK